MSLTKAQRAELKNKYDGRCSYCGVELSTRWQADHFVPIVRNWITLNGKKLYTDCVNPENDCIENMMPSCGPCNNDKSSLSLEDWREAIKHKVFTLNNSHPIYQKAKRYGLVVETDIDVVFWFEKYRS
ncbi:HNH endonuclease [Psychrobacter vallis]|uniref:HNH endonuclease n=1 Tax=Psychrobacter vallis TaxID=248451 RepID=UPI001919C014|nr:HNH endonuclease signature motif containing protein [Psychrobacter vallis]